MSSEMIERVMKAIGEAEGDAWEKIVRDPGTYQAVKTVAFAAIKAMQDTITPEMLQAGWDASLAGYGKSRTIADGQGIFREIFQAMLDVALKD